MRGCLTVCVLFAACRFEPPQGTALDAAVDAGDDGPEPFDRNTCPSTYTLRPNGRTTAYRLVTDMKRRAKDSEVDCRNDSNGDTHLTTLNDLAELAMLRVELNGLENPLDNNFWIGGIQLRDQASPDAGWLSFSGGPLLDGWQNTEPNDANNSEDNSENFVMIGTTRDMVDDGNTTRLAICECDGVPIDPAARAAFDAAP